MMTCPDCGERLDDVPGGQPCPQCGGLRRDASPTAQPATARVEAFRPTIAIGYNSPRPWKQKWQDVLNALGEVTKEKAGCWTRRKAFVQVIPEGAGAVKTSWPGFLVVRSRPGGVGTCRVKAAGPMRGRGPPAKRSEALTPMPCGARCRAPGNYLRGVGAWCAWFVVVSVSKAGSPAGADPRGSCQSSLRRARHGAVRHQRSVGVNQMGRPRHRRWGS
jgi:hypothetical protein